MVAICMNKRAGGRGASRVIDGRREAALKLVILMHRSVVIAATIAVAAVILVVVLKMDALLCMRRYQRSEAVLHRQFLYRAAASRKKKRT